MGFTKVLERMHVLVSQSESQNPLYLPSWHLKNEFSLKKMLTVFFLKLEVQEQRVTLRK